MQIESIASKWQLVPLMFTQDAVADAQSAVAMNIVEVAATVLTVTEYIMPFAGNIVGISLRSDLDRTAGTLTADATINGTVTGVQAVLNATTVNNAHARNGRDNDAFTAGQRIGVKLTTASWTPITADIVVAVWVLVNMEGI